MAKDMKKLEVPKNDEKLVQWWRDRIDLGIKWRWRTSGKNDGHWMRYKAYYRGDWEQQDRLFGEQGIDIDSYLPTNRVFSYIRSTLPKIYFRNPGIFISKGLIVNGVDDAEIIQEGATYLTKELALKKEIKRTILNTLLLGTGVEKLGYGSIYAAGVEAAEEADRRLEHASRVKPGLPWARSVDPVNFVLPFGTKDIEDADWCAHAIWRPLEYAQDDKTYSNRNFTATKIPDVVKFLLGSGDASLSSNQQLWVRFWEIHDKASGKLLIISDKSPSIHYKGDDVLQIEGLPFRLLVFDEDPDSAWGLSTVKIMEPQQLELNDIRTMTSKYRKREFVKILVDTAVPDAAVEAINDASEPMAAIKVPEPNKNVTVLTSSMPQDLPRMGEEADNDMRFEIGFSRNQAGEVSTGRRTAREIDVARQASEIRNDERRDATSDFFASIVSGLLQISFLLMAPEMVKKITGGALWHTRDAKFLPYDLGLEVNPEESRPESSEVKKSDAISLYEVLSQNPIANQVANLAQLLAAFDQPIPEFLDPEIAQAVQVVLRLREEKAKKGSPNA